LLEIRFILPQKPAKNALFSKSKAKGVTIIKEKKQDKKIKKTPTPFSLFN
jgi:hypothetical protein